MAAKMFGVLSYRTGFSLPCFLASRCCCPPREGFPALKVPSLSCRDPPPCFGLRKARRYNQNLGRETEKRWRCGREVESELTLGSAVDEGEGQGQKRNSEKRKTK